jgi:hypothetical protein
MAPKSKPKPSVRKKFVLDVMDKEAKRNSTR